MHIPLLLNYLTLLQEGTYEKRASLALSYAIYHKSN